MSAKPSRQPTAHGASPTIDGRVRRRIESMRKVQSAALELFRTRGYDEVTVEDIATFAGVGPATVYRAFGAKERIVLWDEYDPMILDAVAARLEREPLLEAVQHAITESLASVYARDHVRIRRRARLIAKHPALMAATRDDRDALRDALATLFVRKKVCRDLLDAHIAAGVVVVTLESAVMEWIRRGNATPLEAIFREAFHRLRHML